VKPGNVSEQEIFLICTLIKFFKCKNVLEIGTFNGLTTLQMALNSDNDAKIFTIDLPEGEIHNTKYDLLDWEKDLVTGEGFSVGEFFKNHRVSNKIIQIFGDTAKIDFSPYYNLMDFVFIDGAHHYDYIKSDTENILKCVKNGAIIVWHDFSYSDVTSVGKYLKELSKTLQPLYSIKDTPLALYRVSHDKTVVA
jgi:predicted O-methyltransferase YrrM